MALHRSSRAAGNGGNVATARKVPPLVAGEKVVVFDPGVTTGVAFIKYTGGRNFDLLYVTQLVWGERFSVNNYMKYAGRIVVEDFKLYETKARDQINSDFPSVQVKGIIECYAYQMGMLDRIYYQMASERVNVKVVDPEHRKALESMVHATDAYRHARLHVLMNRAR